MVNSQVSGFCPLLFLLGLGLALVGLQIDF